MKPKIHPKYVDCTITCVCGNVVKTRSTKPKINVEICSHCHPLFTGKTKVLDVAGRVEKFRARQRRAQKPAAEAKKE
jgi:large subunit ribosomal protein L31